jgi:hypothetical protein
VVILINLKFGTITHGFIFFTLQIALLSCHVSIRFFYRGWYAIETILLLNHKKSEMICNGQFTPWPLPMVQLSWSNFFKKNKNYKAFGSLTRCKPNVDQEEWPCTKKWMCWLFEYMSKMNNFARKKNKIKQGLIILLFSLLFTSLM